MTFNHPYCFALLLWLPLLWWRLKKAPHRTFLTFPKVQCLQKAQGQTRGGAKEDFWLFELMALASLMLALTDPQKNETFVKDSKEGMAIQLVLDVSTSMDISINTPEGDQSRLSVAKKVLEQFVLGDGQQLQGRKNDLVGLISFSRYADTLCPLTLSHEALANMIKDIKVNEVPNEDGTAYGDAAALAAAQLDLFETKMQQQNKNDAGKPMAKIIVLLTDGENNCGLHMPLQAAAMAKKWKVKLYAISLGGLALPKKLSREGGSLTVSTSMDQNAWILKQMAEATGGIYRHSHDYNSLYSVYKEIDELEKGQIQTKSLHRQSPSFQNFVVVSLLFMLSSVVFRCWRARRT